MITIKCAKCKKKLLKYHKFGKGKILRCYKDRISENNLIEKNGLYLCSCSNLIGTDSGVFIKMKQNSFIFSGNYE